MITTKFYTCKYDRAFKEILLNEKNKEILQKLLEQILKVTIKEIEFKPTEQNTGNIHIKRKTFDVLLKTNVGKINIEINGYPKNYVRPRNMAYICSVYASHTLIGKEYDEETKIIQINFSYELGKDYKEAYRIYKVQDKKNNEYVTNFIIYEINMDYYKEIWYHGSKEEIEENKYIIMLNLEKEELEKLSKEDEVAKRYMEELFELNKSVEFIEYMSAEEDARKIYNSEITEATQKGLQEGEQRGIKEGEKRNQISIAKRMLEEKMDIALIAKLTHLTKKEIESIKYT